MASLEELYKRFLDNSCTEEELSILLKHFELKEYSQLTQDLLEQELSKSEHDRELPPELTAVLERNRSVIKNKLFTREPKKKGYTIWRYISVASAIVLIGCFSYLYFTGTSNKQVEHKITQVDIEPGTNRAVLQLDDGSSFELADKKSGIQSSVNGITYSDGTTITHSEQIHFASLTTPRKGQYKVVLSDGTKVWLNAESSLRYPVSFTGNERTVELQGEGYFEVAHDTKHPFIVKTKAQQVQVLGTVFNINAYTNEPTLSTTLVSGSVRLKSDKTGIETVLEPRQQAVLSATGYKISQVDIAPYTAWKDGEFRFKATPLPEAIRQLERWYDLDVDYTTIPATVKINVSISRNKKLSSVLDVLSEISDVKFKTQGRRLIMTE